MYSATFRAMAIATAISCSVLTIFGATQHPVDPLGSHSVNELDIRRATPGDAAAIREIYNYEVENETSTFDLVPRTLEVQQAWIMERSGAFAVVVATLNGQVVGFGALSEYRDRAAYSTSVEDSIYVSRAHGRQGIGKAILTHLLNEADASGFHTVMARIGAASVASRALHEACGFTLVGIEREVGRKFGRWLDVALMQCILHERKRI